MKGDRTRRGPISGGGEQISRRGGRKPASRAELLNLSAAARMTSLSRDTLKRAIHQGRLAAVITKSANRRNYGIVETVLARYELRHIVALADAQQRGPQATARKKPNRSRSALRSGNGEDGTGTDGGR